MYCTYAHTKNGTEILLKQIYRIVKYSRGSRNKPTYVYPSNFPPVVPKPYLVNSRYTLVLKLDTYSQQILTQNN